MIWNKEAEQIGRSDLEQLQLEKLKHTVRYVYDNVEHYHKKLDEMKVSPDRIKTLSDIKYLPFTTKDDLRENYPYGLFAVPRKQLVRIHGSSGTTGKPTIVGYTRADLDMWSECMARLITATGVTDEDVAQISFGYGLFTGALGLQQGLEKVGATVIPISSGNTERQIMLMQDMETTVLISTPSYALYIGEKLQELGVPLDRLKLRIGLFGGEGHTPEMRKQIESRLGILATENYGLSEVVGPGVSGECYKQCGLHINEDHFLVETIDPETGEVLQPGEVGEMVITPLSKEAFPVLRYRTKDLSYLIDEPCACGRTTRRMAKVQGRTDDMLIIKGVNVFPSQIEGVLMGIEQIGPYYQIYVKKQGIMDALEVVVEPNNSSLLERFSELEKLEKMIKHKLHTVLNIDVKVRLAEPKTIERTAGKAKHVIDLRGE